MVRPSTQQQQQTSTRLAATACRIVVLYPDKSGQYQNFTNPPQSTALHAGAWPEPQPAEVSESSPDNHGDVTCQSLNQCPWAWISKSDGCMCSLQSLPPNVSKCECTDIGHSFAVADNRTWRMLEVEARARPGEILPITSRTFE
eukprot:scpid4026/ scgid14901/ 